MFALRGIAVSLTFFVLVYCCLSALVAVSWRWLRWLHTSGRSLADLLFLLRILPLAGSVVITLALVVPSFDILEPRSVNEGTGTVPLLLGAAALLLVSFGSWRVITAQTRTARVTARWLDGASVFEAGSPTVTLRSSRAIPPLSLIGMHRPRVLVSDSTVEVLSASELNIALRHELAHVRSCDNLKKLIFRFAPFPGMGSLESAWAQTAEFAADDAAVASANDAVDLASALVKLSRLVLGASSGREEAAAEPTAICTVGFVTGSLSARVARLLSWVEGGSRPANVPRWIALPPIAAMIGCAIVAYGPALAITHEMTEWLVR